MSQTIFRVAVYTNEFIVDLELVGGIYSISFIPIQNIHLNSEKLTRRCFKNICSIAYTFNNFNLIVVLIL